MKNALKLLYLLGLLLVGMALKAQPFDFTFTVADCNEVSFTITGGTPVAQQWDFGDGDQNTAPNPVHYYGITGAFNACLTASDGLSTQQVCKVITIDSTDCCNGPVPTFTDVDNCCFDLALDNPINQFFTGVRLKSATGNLVPVAGFDATQWGLPGPPTASEIHLNYTAMPHLPTGVTAAFRFCLANPPITTATVEVEWLIGPEVVCTETVDLNCTSCQPEGPTFSTTIGAEPDPTITMDYEERGYDLTFDPAAGEFTVFGVTELLNEIGTNGNVYFSRLDECGEQIEDPVIAGATEPILYEVVDVRAVDVRGEGLRLGSATAFFGYVLVATIRKGPRYDYVIITLRDDGTYDFAQEEIFESGPDEFINDISYDPVDNCLGIVGTRRDGLPATSKVFVQKICFSNTTGVLRSRREYDIAGTATPARSTGEAITYDSDSKSWFVTGQTPDKKMYVMQLDNGLNVIHTEFVDIDADGATEETGKDIVITPANELAVVSDVRAGGLTNGTSKVALTTLRLPLLPQCDNVKLNRLYDLPGQVEEVNSLVARPQVQGGGTVYTFGGDLDAGLVIVGSEERRRPFVMQVAQDGSPRWVHRYNEANHLEKLIAAEDGFAAVGRTSTVSGGFPASTITNDIWSARMDSNGILPECDCFDPIEAVVEAPQQDNNCRDVDELDIPPVVNFRDWQSVRIGREQEYCTGPCGTGVGGDPCPNNDCSYISGVKFEDVNGDSIQDPFDPNLCGWTIELVDAVTGAVVATTQTNSAGFYAFPGVMAGQYFVREVQQSCWSQTFPTAGSGQHAVTATGRSYHFNLNFGNTIDIDCTTDKATRLTQTGGVPQCSHNLEIDNNLCLDLQRVHVRTTNGVMFDVALTTPLPGYQFCLLYPPTATEICLELAGGGPIPRANGQQLVDFVYDDICSYQQVPQSIIIDYHVDLPCSFDKVVCSDTLVTECPAYCPDLCTGVSAQYQPSMNGEDCCFDLLITNNRPDMFTRVNVDVLGATVMTTSNITAANWFFTQQSSSRLELIQTLGNNCPGSGLAFLPVGTYSPVTVCLDEPGNTPALEVEFLACNEQFCRDTLNFECSPPPGCVDITRDTFYCDSSGIYKYEFDFLSNWDKDVKSVTVNHLLPNSATVTPTSINYMPPVSPGGTGSGVLCFDNLDPTLPLEFQLQFFEDSCCFCFSDTIRRELPECPCDECEDITYDTRFIGTDTTCCWALDIDNPCLEDMKSIELRGLNGLAFQTLTAGSGWFFQNVSTSQTRFQPLLPPPGTTPVPTGPINGKIEFCLTSFGGPLPFPQQLEVNWIDMMDEVACSDTLTFDCTPPPPDTCLVIVGDTMVCLPDGTYEYRWNVVNQSSTTTTHIYVHTSYTTPAGGTITPGAPYSFPVVIPPNVAPIAMPAINVGNVSPGDQFCLVPSIYNTITSPPNGNFCCHADTTCVMVPECEPDPQECCLEEPFFDALNSYVFTRSGNLVTVTNPLFGPCMIVRIDWGDGNVVDYGPFAFPITHTYVPGTEPGEICLLQTELVNNDPNMVCFEGERCFPLQEGCEPCENRLWWREIESGGTLAIIDLEPYHGEMIYCGSTGGTIDGYSVTNVGRYDGVDHFDMAPPTDFEVENLLSTPQGLFATALHRTAGVPDGYDLLRWDVGTNNWIPEGLNPRLNLFSDYGRLDGLTNHPQGILLFGYFDAFTGVGGAFSNLAIYDPISGIVSPVAGNFDDEISSAYHDGTSLYVGGQFTSPQMKVARYDGTTWHPLGGGIDPVALNASIEGVNIIEPVGSEVWIGGAFNAAKQTGGTNVTGTKALAAYDPGSDSFSSVGGGVTSTSNVHSVAAIKEIGGDVYIGGHFSSIGGQNHTGMVRWDGTNYVSLGTGAFLATFDFSCLKDENGYCEVIVGAENLFGELVCRPVATEGAPSAVDLTVLPNPTNGLLRVNWPETFEPMMIVVIDARGREVFRRTTASDTEIEVDLSQQPAGLYFLRLEDKTGSGVIKRVIRR